MATQLSAHPAAPANILNAPANPLRGILPAVVSPHDGNDNFCPRSFARHIEFLYAQGVHGVYICGGTGEGFAMRLEERKTAMEIAAELSKFRGITIDHVGAQCTRDAAELAGHAARCGASALASMPPIAKTQQELCRYYAELAQISGLPVLVYYIPAFTGRHSSLAELIELLDIDGVCGMKFTDPNLFLMRRILDARPDKIIFSGFDEMLFPALLYGAAGGIGAWYNVIPKAFLNIFAAAVASDCSAGWRWQHSFIKLAEIGWRFGIPAVIELLLRQRGEVLRCFRAPYSALPDDLERQVTPQLEKILEAMDKLAVCS